MDLVFLEHVRDLRLQRLEQGVCLVAHVGADFERLGQIPSQLARGVRKAVFPLLGEVRAQPVERMEPEVEQNEVQRREGDADLRRRAVASGAGAGAPTLHVQRQGVEEQEERRHRPVIHQVAHVDDAALNALEAAARADGAEHRADRGADEVRHTPRADEVEDTPDERRRDERDDLVARPRRQEQADSRVCRRQQRCREVPPDDGARVEVAKERNCNR